MHQHINKESLHIVETCCRIYGEEAFGGFCASKKKCFYGLKVCLIVTQTGEPVEVMLVLGGTPDIVR